MYRLTRFGSLPFRAVQKGYTQFSETSGQKWNEIRLCDKSINLEDKLKKTLEMKHLWEGEINNDNSNLRERIFEVKRFLFDRMAVSPHTFAKNVPLNFPSLEKIDTVWFNNVGFKTHSKEFNEFLERYGVNNLWIENSTGGCRNFLSDKTFEIVRGNIDVSMNRIEKTPGDPEITNKTIELLMENPRHLFKLVNYQTGFSQKALTSIIKKTIAKSESTNMDFGRIDVAGCSEELALLKMKILSMKKQYEERKFSINANDYTEHKITISKSTTFSFILGGNGVTNGKK